MDERSWSLLTAYREFLDEAVTYARAQAEAGGTRVADALEEFLGHPPSQLPVVRLDVPHHQFVNLDVAMAELVSAQGGGTTLGIGGGDQRHHQTFGDMVQSRGPWSLTVGAVDRDREDTGPHSSREVMTMGIHLFRYDGVPVAALQRRANPQFGQATGLEVVAPEAVTGPLLSDVRRLMVERSVYRGQVLSLGAGDPTYGQRTGGVTFLERPRLDSSDVVLPPGALQRVERHVVGTAHHRDALRAAGQHLKRGLLLYGPPGTGKTHTVRYLLGRLPDVTAVVLAGNALGLVAQATELAHALEPAVVVLEDVDLIAEHRDLYHAPQPLLFTLLDAMDGLTSEADVAFLLTTNRPDLLETALSQRPGRVDMAVEIPLPDAGARRALLALYGRAVTLSEGATTHVVESTAGCTASFFKELVRRVVLTSAEAGVRPDDTVLEATLAEMLGDGEHVTRALLGSTDSDRA